MLKVQRSISVIVAVALLVLIAAGAAVILWSWLSGQAGSLPQTPAPLMSGRPLIEAVKVGPGFVDVIASCVGGECGVASIILTEPATGTVVAFYGPPEALRLSSEPRDIVVPLMALNASRVAESVLLVLTTTNGVESAYQVSLEGLWWLGTWASLGNYIDHVVRVTIFLNGTVRLEVVRASGCYLHMPLMPLYRHSGLPPFDSIPQIVSSYQSHNYTLPPEAGVLYVKSHGAWAPASDMDRRIWDPVRQRCIETWPYIILVHP